MASPITAKKIFFQVIFINIIRFDRMMFLWQGRQLLCLIVKKSPRVWGLSSHAAGIRVGSHSVPTQPCALLPILCESPPSAGAFPFLGCWPCHDPSRYLSLHKTWLTDDYFKKSQKQGLVSNPLIDWWDRNSSESPFDGFLCAPSPLSLRPSIKSKSQADVRGTKLKNHRSKD